MIRPSAPKPARGQLEWTSATSARLREFMMAKKSRRNRRRWRKQPRRQKPQSQARPARGTRARHDGHSRCYGWVGWPLAQAGRPQDVHLRHPGIDRREVRSQPSGQIPSPAAVHATARQINGWLHRQKPPERSHHDRRIIHKQRADPRRVPLVLRWAALIGRYVFDNCTIYNLRDIHKNP